MMVVTNVKFYQFTKVNLYIILKHYICNNIKISKTKDHGNA